MSFLFGGGAKDTHTTENKLSGVRIQQSSQGVPIPIVYGVTRVTVNILWYGDFTAIPHTTEQEVGGKGGGGSTATNTTFTYTAGAIFGVCEGPITSYGKVWENKKITDTNKVGLTEFLGTYTQNEWSYMSTYHPTQAFKYRGTAYLGGSAIDLGNSDSLPNFSFEINGIPFADVITVYNVTSLGTEIVYNPLLDEIWVDGYPGINRIRASDGVDLGIITGANYPNGAYNWYNPITGRIYATKYSGGDFGMAIYNAANATWQQTVASWTGTLVNFWINQNNGAMWTTGGDISYSAINGTIKKLDPVGLGAPTSYALTAPAPFPMTFDSTNFIWGLVLKATGSKIVKYDPSNPSSKTEYDVLGTFESQDIIYDNDRNSLWMVFQNTIKEFNIGSTSIVQSATLSAYIYAGSDGVQWLYDSGKSTIWAISYSPVAKSIVGIRTSDATVCKTIDFSAIWTPRSLALDVNGNLWVSDGGNIPQVAKIVFGGDPVSGDDKNPRDVLVDILTNVNYGAGFPSAQLDSFDDLASYCSAAGIFISPAYVAQTPASDIATELCLIGNAAPVWSEGVLKVIPYADANVGTYVPNTTINYALTDDDFIAEAGEEPVKGYEKTSS